MAEFRDGPISDRFVPLDYKGNTSFDKITDIAISGEMSAAIANAPSGECVGWGIPFEIRDVVAVVDKPVAISLSPFRAQWLVFLHTSDRRRQEINSSGFISPAQGAGQLAEHAADYVILYSDGTEERASIRRLHQVGGFYPAILDKCFEAVACHKPYPRRASHEQPVADWGMSQWRVEQPDFVEPWTNWLWAWKNPCMDKSIVGVRFEPVTGVLLVSAISAGNASALPLRWQTRRKACLTLQEGVSFRPALDSDGSLEHIKLDMGQIISATPRAVYPNETWTETYNNKAPEVSERQILIEYTAHRDAHFHLSNGSTIAVSDIERGRSSVSIKPVSPATRNVAVRVVEKGKSNSVAAKLHIHGEAGEYLAPSDRHRIVNTAWFEDSGVELASLGHSCAYIRGETTVKLPLGNVYIEVSKGFEIKPIRRMVEVTADTDEILVEIDRVLPWRSNGWVTADTHVHYLTPTSALLEGAAEGVNVVNLLASQWGEWMTNVGDFDGKTTWGSKEAGGDGEYLVRVGTENRQHVLGHISLLGYQGRIIEPICTGGPDESALGDPVEALLTEWARQCKKQGGLVVLPHFAYPRAEGAATIVNGDVDAVEMRSDPFPWAALYGGIDPYSLSDWYRFLNCGYMIPAVAGTDKESTTIAVGTIRTYAYVGLSEPFTYDRWMGAVRRAQTFVTHGPLLDFTVDGKPMGSRLEMPATGGSVEVTWKVASVTIPMSRVELVVNGEIQESLEVPSWEVSGHWSVKVDKSCWLALLVRGHYEDKPEIITAHSSPVMVGVEGSPMLAAADAVTILEQIEGTMIYLDTIGTRAEDAVYKRMRMLLTSSHRALHNRMHEIGSYHDHTSLTDHTEHH
jgi:hypothetical protein